MQTRKRLAVEGLFPDIAIMPHLLTWLVTKKNFSASILSQVFNLHGIPQVEQISLPGDDHYKQ